MTRKQLLSVMVLTGAFLICGDYAHAKKKGYGMAGCGLGTLAFGAEKNEMFPQLLSWGIDQYLCGGTFQSSGITSGTLNCKDDWMETAALYININRVAVRRDIARGSGEAVDGLAKIYGCPSGERLGGVLQNSFDSIYTGENPSALDVSNRINEAVKQSEIASACDSLS